MYVKTIRLRHAFTALTAAGTVLVLGVSQVASVYAATSSATTKQSTVNNSATLKISPVRTDLTLEAGKSGTVKVYVTNMTSAPVLIKPIENDFVAGDEKGTPSIILDENSYAPTHSLKRFMVPLQNVTVPAKGTQEVNVTITVPKSAQAGGYYGAIRFAPVSADGSKQVNLSASVASLILLTVPGDLIEQLTLTNFDIQQNGGTATNFRTPDDLSLLVRFQNKGNVQAAPFGQIYVQKGKQVVYRYNFNQTDPREQILPDSARRWSIPVKSLGKFGKYTIGATFTYGTKGQAIEITKTIWIVPTTYIIGGLVALAAVVGLILGLWIFLRSYKRRILRSSRRRY